MGAFAGQQGTFMKGHALGSVGAEALIVEVGAFLLVGVVFQLNRAELEVEVGFLNGDVESWGGDGGRDTAALGEGGPALRVVFLVIVIEFGQFMFFS